MRFDSLFAAAGLLSLPLAAQTAAQQSEPPRQRATPRFEAARAPSRSRAPEPASLPRLPCAEPEAAAGAPVPEPREFQAFLLEHPCPRRNAEFGFSVVALDFDGDGKRDFAVGAAGEGAVYILLGGGPVPFQLFGIFDASGRTTCEHEEHDDRFGTALAAGDLDGDGDDELVVGAPAARTPLPLGARVGAAYVLGLWPTAPPLRFQPRTTIDEGFGQSLALADFDQDGHLDLAVGAVRAHVDGISCGRVSLYQDLLGPAAAALEFPDPSPTEGGNFGIHLAVDDTDGDGYQDLFVSGIGNDSSSGVANGGQVYGFLGVPHPDRWVLVEDGFEIPFDPPRFGMHIDARGGFLTVGAPRKDTRDLVDSGLGQSFQGAGQASARSHAHPRARPNDLFGYRSLIGDFVGDASLDFAFSCLPNLYGPEHNPLAVYIFDGSDAGGWPLELLALPDSGDHFTMGVAALDFDGDGREDLVLGDTKYDRPGENAHDDVGRVVIYH